MNLETLIKEVLELDEKATKGPFYTGHMSEDYDTRDMHEQENGLLVCETISTINFNCFSHYRTSAPKLARALLIATSTLKNIIDVERFSEDKKSEIERDCENTLAEIEKIAGE